jgi:hypothetical protein
MHLILAYVFQPTASVFLKLWNKNRDNKKTLYTYSYHIFIRRCKTSAADAAS